FAAQLRDLRVVGAQERLAEQLVELVGRLFRELAEELLVQLPQPCLAAAGQQVGQRRALLDAAFEHRRVEAPEHAFEGGAHAGHVPGAAAGRTAIDSRDGLSHDSTAPGGSAGAGGGAAAGPSGAAVHGVFSSDPWSGRDASTGAGVMPKARSGSASAAVFGCTTGAPIGVWPSGSAAGVPEPRPN